MIFNQGTVPGSGAQSSGLLSVTRARGGRAAAARGSGDANSVGRADALLSGPTATIFRQRSALFADFQPPEMWLGHTRATWPQHCCVILLVLTACHSRADLPRTAGLLRCELPIDGHRLGPDTEQH